MKTDNPDAAAAGRRAAPRVPRNVAVIHSSEIADDPGGWHGAYVRVEDYDAAALALQARQEPSIHRVHLCLSLGQVLGQAFDGASMEEAAAELLKRLTAAEAALQARAREQECLEIQLANKQQRHADDIEQWRQACLVEREQKAAAEADRARLLAGLQQLRQEWKARSGSTTFHQAACGAFKLCAEELNDILATLIGEAAPRPPRQEKEEQSRGVGFPESEHGDLPRRPKGDK